VQLTDGYVHIRDGELFLIGCRINALRSASTHVQPEADRTKKLLMHKDEIRRLIGKVEQKGFTLVPLNLHYKGGRVKAEIALAKGKAEHDKRDTEKKRDWEREKGRLMRHKVSGPAEPRPSGSASSSPAPAPGRPQVGHRFQPDREAHQRALP
jgi:SsrA-binding protein